MFQVLWEARRKSDTQNQPWKFPNASLSGVEREVRELDRLVRSNHACLRGWRSPVGDLVAELTSEE